MERDFFRLDGRIVVVSGAAGGGIGTTVTRMVAEAGATVVAVSRGQDNLDRHLGPLLAEGLSVVPVAADASTDDGVGATLEAVRRTLDAGRWVLVGYSGGNLRPTEYGATAAMFFTSSRPAFTSGT